MTQYAVVTSDSGFGKRLLFGWWHEILVVTQYAVGTRDSRFDKRLLLGLLIKLRRQGRFLVSALQISYKTVKKWGCAVGKRFLLWWLIKQCWHGILVLTSFSSSDYSSPFLYNFGFLITNYKKFFLISPSFFRFLMFNFTPIFSFFSWLCVSQWLALHLFWTIIWIYYHTYQRFLC